MTNEKQHVAMRRAPLPVAIVVGMPVTQVNGEPDGTIVGLTQSYCIYELRRTSSLAVARWSEVAVGNVCPLNSVLPADTSENDRRNWSAALLRELLGLRPFGLTASQNAVHDELIEYLCPPALARRRDRNPRDTEIG